MSPNGEVDPFALPAVDPFALPEVSPFLSTVFSDVADVAGSFYDFINPEHQDFLSFAADVVVSPPAGLAEDVARVVAGGFRNECLSVRVPGVPFGEYVATAADWWAEQAVTAFGQPVRAAGQVNDSIGYQIQNLLGIPGKPNPADAGRPRARAGMNPEAGGFLVQVPGWMDIFQFNNDAVFSERSKQQRAIDYAENLQRSPTPPSLQEVGELLTTLDDIQDETATLAVVLMLAEKLAGRSIPGVGWVATAADALNVIQALSSKATGSSLPGRAGKRRAAGKAQQTRDGYGGRLDNARRTRAIDQAMDAAIGPRLPQIEAPRAGLKIGWGDALQALQASDSMFGTGVQIGAVMGFMQDAFWTGIRGGEFRAAGPVWDPLGFTEQGRHACYRSPTLDQIHPQAHFVLSNIALSVWKKAARVMPYLDVFGEQALASTLTGLRLSEQVLGPWLRSGVWVDQLSRAVEVIRSVPGGVEAHDTRQLRPDQWVPRTAPAARVAVTRAIGNVADRGRQGLYESMVSSIGWGFAGSLEPGARVVDRQLMGPIRDAVLLLDANKIPLFDLDD